MHQRVCMSSFVNPTLDKLQEARKESFHRPSGEVRVSQNRRIRPSV